MRKQREEERRESDSEEPELPPPPLPEDAPYAGVEGSRLVRLTQHAKGRDVQGRRGLALVAALLVLSVPAAIWAYVVLFTGNVSVSGGRMDVLSTVSVIQETGRYVPLFD